MVACLKTYIILSITVTKGHSGLSVSFKSNIQSFNMLAKMVCLNLKVLAVELVMLLYTLAYSLNAGISYIP